jgi:hypothetical protein
MVSRYSTPTVLLPSTVTESREQNGWIAAIIS